MPDFGLTKGMRKAIKGAKVVRPGEIDAAAKKAAQVPAPVADEAIQPQELAPQPKPVAEPLVEPVAVPVADAAVEAMPESVVRIQSSRLSQANLGDYALDEKWQTNFDTITTTDDIKAVIADVATQNAPKIQEARRFNVTNEQLRGLASDLDLNEDVVKAVMTRESGGVLKPEVILAARQVLNSSAERVLTLAKKVNTGHANDFERLAFRRQILFHNEYQTQFMGARAEAGRALNAFGIPVGSDANQLARMRELVEGLHGKDTDELAKALSQVDSLQGVNKLAKEYSRSKLLGTTQELFINSILSGPKTHLVNAIGNGLFQGMNIAETAVAARLGRFLSGEEHVMAGEASAMLYGTVSGWRDGLRLAAKTFKTGTPIDQVAKYEGQSRAAISSKNLLPAKLQDGMLGSAVDGLGAFIRLPTERVMAPTDEFFKTVAYRAELSRQAYLHAQRMVDEGGLSTKDVGGAIQSFMENPPGSAVDLAEDYITYATFQNPLGPTGQKFQQAIQSLPAGFLIAPFIRTPVNVFKAGYAERSPLALFSSNWRAQVARGGRDRDLALARAGMGTLTVGLTAMAATSGGITGGGPQDPKARKLLEASGWQPYSFRIENETTGEVTYQSYARAEPLAFVIGATADAVEVMSYLDYDDELKSEAEQVNTAIAAITAGVANNTMSKTFMQGVADFSEAMSDPTQYMKGYLQKQGMAMLPYSSFRRQASQMQDPIMREAWTLLDRVKVGSGIPGYSENAPPRRDVFGSPITQRGGSALGVMSPFPDTEGKKDRVLDEVVGLMNETRQVPISMPGKKVDGMRLSAQEYDEYVRYSRTEPLFDGRTFHEEIERVMDTSAYLLSTPDSRVLLIKHVQEAADSAARGMLEKNNPDFAARIAGQRLKKQRRLLGDEVMP